MPATPPPWLAPLLLLLLLLAGGLFVDDYGISWDEAIQRRHGRISVDYVDTRLGTGPGDGTPREPDYELATYQWANYGMLFQITATVLEEGLGIAPDDHYRYYRLRHLLTLGLFGLALLCFYRTLRLRWPAGWLPLVGCTLLVLSPRILANAFFNPKDHVLLCLYLIATYALLRFLRYRGWGSLVGLAVASALALNTRLPALVIPAAAVAILLWEQLFNHPGNRRRLAQIAVYLPLTALCMIPIWPYLWEDTWARFVGAFTQMAAFPWGGFGRLFGDEFTNGDVPAYYVPAWIAVTTPVVYLVFLLAGLWAAARGSIASVVADRHLGVGFAGLADFTQLGLGLGPVLMVIILDSTLYNGWRHLHFVYPALVYLMVLGYDWLRHAPAGRPRRWVTALLAGGLTIGAVETVRYHPHQYAYFNLLVHGHPTAERFDTDYWGTSLRNLLIALADRHPTATAEQPLRIRCQSWPCQDNLRALPPAYRGRLVAEPDWSRADYVVTHFNYELDAKQLEDRQDYFAFPAVELRRGGHTISGAYDLRALRAARRQENQ